MKIVKNKSIYILRVIKKETANWRFIVSNAEEKKANCRSLLGNAELTNANLPYIHILHSTFFNSTLFSSAFFSFAIFSSVKEDTVHILGLQNTNDYDCLNPVEITIDSNSIIETLSNYKMHDLQNNTDVTFIKRHGLTEAKAALINSKLYKTLGVVYLSEIKGWDLIKNDSKASRSAFAFTTKSVSDLSNFTLLDELGNVITFPSIETKVPTLSFKIQIMK